MAILFIQNTYEMLVYTKIAPNITNKILSPHRIYKLESFNQRILCLKAATYPTFAT